MTTSIEARSDPRPAREPAVSVTGLPRTLVLFTRDLRIHDHPALSAAAARGEVVPLVVLDPGLLARSPNRARFYPGVSGGPRRVRSRVWAAG